MNLLNLALLGEASADGGGPGIVFVVIYLAFLVAIIAGFWQVLSKAGQPGWGILIPIYNAYLILKVAGRPGWWLILFFIPLVNFIIGIVVLRWTWRRTSARAWDSPLG